MARILQTVPLHLIYFLLDLHLYLPGFFFIYLFFLAQEADVGVDSGSVRMPVAELDDPVHVATLASLVQRQQETDHLVAAWRAHVVLVGAEGGGREEGKEKREREEDREGGSIGMMEGRMKAKDRKARKERAINSGR